VSEHKLHLSIINEKKSAIILHLQLNSPSYTTLQTKRNTTLISMEIPKINMINQQRWSQIQCYHKSTPCHISVKKCKTKISPWCGHCMYCDILKDTSKLTAMSNSQNVEFYLFEGITALVSQLSVKIFTNKTKCRYLLKCFCQFWDLFMPQQCCQNSINVLYGMKTFNTLTLWCLIGKLYVTIVQKKHFYMNPWITSCSIKGEVSAFHDQCPWSCNARQLK